MTEKEKCPAYLFLNIHKCIKKWLFVIIVPT